MRGLRRTLLGVLATAVTAAGVLAPTAAQAATTAIHWDTSSGATLDASRQASVCTQGMWDDFERGQTVVVQVLLSGAWTTKQQIVTDGWANCVPVTPSELVSGPGTYSFRAQFRPSPETAVLTASATYTLVKEASFAWTGDSFDYFSLTTTPNRSLPLSVSPARGQAVDLQRKWNGNWVTVSHATAATVDSSPPIDVPVPTRPGTGTYRAVVRGTTWSTQSISHTFFLHQTDYAKHKSYLATARQHMARFCPGTPIYIDSPDVVRGNAYGSNGRATGQWRQAIPSQSGFLRTRIELQSGLTGTYLKHVALHECAHVVQFRADVENKYELEMQRASNLWRTVPGPEGQADCMSYVITKSKASMDYVNDCTTTQVANATRMWQDYGLEYQSNPYEWSVAGAASSETPKEVTVVRATGEGG
jgi:hypothetical protein